MKTDTKIRRSIVASQIKEAMSLRAMNRKQLADAVRRRPSDVTKWLSGNHNFTIDLLSEISEALGTQITGVADTNAHHSPYNYRSTDSNNICLTDPCFSGNYPIGPIELPDDTFFRLFNKAAQRGEGIEAYVKGLLLREASKTAAKASEFCGIWNEDDFGMTPEQQISDIKSHRTTHRKLEEL